jgi:hypothetical protein
MTPEVSTPLSEPLPHAGGQASRQARNRASRVADDRPRPAAKGLGLAPVISRRRPACRRCGTRHVESAATLRSARL